MATIRVEHKHALTRDEAIERARNVIREFSERLKAEVRWSGPDATFKGTGFSGTAKVDDGLVHVSVDLSLVLRPMKAKIESKLAKALEERFV